MVRKFMVQGRVFESSPSAPGSGPRREETSCFWPRDGERPGCHAGKDGSGASEASAGGDDVSMAQGDRLFPRLVEQLTAPNMAPERLMEALRTVCDLCSHQESKTVAISSDVIAAATHLLLHDAVPVRRDACRVISSMPVAKSTFLSRNRP
eukprot:s2352_g5.t1